MVLEFFDKIAFRIFLFSKTIHNNIFGKGDNSSDAKIQTFFVISLFQCFNIFFILLDLFLFKVFNTHTPKYIIVIGMILICIFNYIRYYKSDRLAEMDNKESLFFKNVYLTYGITILYFIVTVFLFKAIGDIISSASL